VTRAVKRAVCIEAMYTNNPMDDRSYAHARAQTCAPHAAQRLPTFRCSPMLPFARSDRISLKPITGLYLFAPMRPRVPQGVGTPADANGKRYPRPGLWYLILIAAHSAPSSPAFEYPLPSPRACLRSFIIGTFSWPCDLGRPSLAARSTCAWRMAHLQTSSDCADKQVWDSRISILDSRFSARGKNERANWIDLEFFF